MAKQAKAKPASAKGRNDQRPNGKAWKKSWGTNPPVETARQDHEKSVYRRTVKPSTRRRGK